MTHTVYVLAVIDHDLQMTGVGWYTSDPLNMSWNRKVGTLVELFRVTDETVEKARDQALLIYPKIASPAMLAKFPLKS